MRILLLRLRPIMRLGYCSLNATICVVSCVFLCFFDTASQPLGWNVHRVVYSRRETMVRAMHRRGGGQNGGMIGCSLCLLHPFS